MALHMIQWWSSNTYSRALVRVWGWSHLLLTQLCKQSRKRQFSEREKTKSLCKRATASRSHLNLSIMTLPSGRSPQSSFPKDSTKIVNGHSHLKVSHVIRLHSLHLWAVSASVLERLLLRWQSDSRCLYFTTSLTLSLWTMKLKAITKTHTVSVVKRK